MAKEEESFEAEITILEKDGVTEFTEKIKLHKEKSSKAFQDFVLKVKTEATETKVASQIFMKYVKEGNISEQEELELKTQVYDLLKVLGIGVPFALIPGASLLMPFLLKIAKKKGIEILPTAFNEKTPSDKIDPKN